MDRKNLLLRSLLSVLATLLAVRCFTACQKAGEPALKPSLEVIPIASATLTASAVSTDTPTPTETAVPTETSPPTETLTPTEERVIDLNPAVIQWLLDPCKTRFQPIDGEYPNPQENLDPLTGTTWMAITLEEGFLSEYFNFHYWWNTRSFRGDLSFNVGDGPCEVLLETNQIRCEGIPLKGTENLPTGGYEYEFGIFLQDHDCNRGANYSQNGLIFMDTMEHEVFMVNGEVVP